MILTKNTRMGAAVLAGTLVIGACAEAATDEPTADVVETSTSESSAAATTRSDSTTSESTTPESTTSSEADSIAVSGYLGDYELVNEDFGTMVTVTVDGDVRTIATNALPDHATGEFPNQGNPNTIAAQNITYEYPSVGIVTDTATPVRTTGVAVNGVKFEPGTGESVTCESGETFRIEALQAVYDLGIDFNNAHVQPDGEYHYHGISELLVDAYSVDEDLVHVGFASDGHLIYFSKSGAFASSYELSTDARVGTDCTASGPAGGDPVAIADSSPDGTYTSDWSYVDGAGDLDECNGTTVDGDYVYVVTNEYPFIGRCVMGEAAGDLGAGPAPGGAAPDDAAGQPGTGAPDFTDAAAALGITVAELEAALGGPPPDLDAAAATLGITVAELEAVLPPPPGATPQP